MHPAFSVIFFTTMSGAGYGLWFWLGAMTALDQPLPRTAALIALALGFIFTSLGLLSSTLHLGQPLRAWRAFSQWRTSWLSREGVASMACLLPALGFAVAIWRGQDARLFGAVLAVISLATVACTAMIYVSLKPIPAWRHALVLPGYLLFALLGGGLAYAAARGWAGMAIDNDIGVAAMAGCFGLWRMKRRYWKDIDRGVMPATRASALGLPADRSVRVFEHPHTEANYLTKEMGFVLARKHSRKLRLIAVVMFAGVPGLCASLVWLLPHLNAAPWLTIAAVSALLGAFVERWLFFAEAKHMVTLYY
jgi:DMSO reductase anchor subunit